MLIILDTCNVAIAGEPTGGVTIKLSEIEGLPNTVLLVPIQREAAQQLIEGARTMMGNHLQKADLADMRKATRGS